MRFSFRFTILAALTLPASGPSSLGAQTPAPRSAVIAVFQDYPAFRASNRKQSTPELQAIVIPSDFMEKDRSLIIVNPRYATPQVLFAAITRLNTISAARRQNTIFTITQSNRALAHALDASVVSALARAIQDLSDRPVSKLRGHPAGKQIVLTDELRKVVVDAQSAANP